MAADDTTGEYMIFLLGPNGELKTTEDGEELKHVVFPAFDEGAAKPIDVIPGPNGNDFYIRFHYPDEYEDVPADSWYVMQINAGGYPTESGFWMLPGDEGYSLAMSKIETPPYASSSRRLWPVKRESSGFSQMGYKAPENGEPIFLASKVKWYQLEKADNSNILNDPDCRIVTVAPSIIINGSAANFGQAANTVKSEPILSLVYKQPVARKEDDDEFGSNLAFG